MESLSLSLGTEELRLSATSQSHHESEEVLVFCRGAGGLGCEQLVDIQKLGHRLVLALILLAVAVAAEAQHGGGLVDHRVEEAWGDLGHFHNHGRLCSW